MRTIFILLRHLWRRWYGHGRCLTRIGRLELELGLTDRALLHPPRRNPILEVQRAFGIPEYVRGGYQLPMAPSASAGAPKHYQRMTRQGFVEAQKRGLLPPGSVVRFDGLDTVDLVSSGPLRYAPGEIWSLDGSS